MADGTTIGDAEAAVAAVVAAEPGALVALDVADRLAGTVPAALVPRAVWRLVDRGALRFTADLELLPA